MRVEDQVLAVLPTESSRSCIVQMDLNEVPYSLEESFKGCQWTRGMNRYDRQGYASFCLVLSRFAGVDPCNLHIFGGADGALAFLFQYFSNQQKRFFLPRHSYPGFLEMAKHNACGFQFYDIDKLADLTKYGGENDVIVVCNPNNPTGELIPDLRNLMSRTQALVIVDEAYIECCSEESLCPVTTEVKNLFVVRTFSKAFAVPGARVGYLCCHAEWNFSFLKVKPRYPVASSSIEICLALLRDQGRMWFLLQKLLKQSSLLALSVREMGLKVSQTSTYFFSILSESEDDADLMYEFFKDRGVLVGDFKTACMLRVTTSDLNSNQAFQRVLGQYLQIKGRVGAT